MKKSLIILAVLACSSAFATNQTQPDPVTINTSQGQQQGQGQIQGQQQGQQQANEQTNNQTNNQANTQTNNQTTTANPTASSVSASNPSANAAGGQASSRSNSSSKSESNNRNEINIAAQERNPVSTATAPALTVANGTCMGSTSGGAQGASFGFSIGGTWVDEGCDIRYDAATLFVLAERRAAINRMCDKKEVRKALRSAGTICPQDQEEEQYCKAYTGNDPIVMRRMGCN